VVEVSLYEFALVEATLLKEEPQALGLAVVR
jgi:hypothetical protein